MTRVFRLGTKKIPKERDLASIWLFERGAINARGVRSPKTVEISVNRKPRAYVSKDRLLTGTTFQEKLSLIQALARNNIWPPRVRSVDYASHLIEFEPAGEMLHAVLMRQRNSMEESGIATPISEGKQRPAARWRFSRHKSAFERNRRELLSKVARMIGRMHSLGIRHGHPHAGNIVVSKNRVGSIDFSKLTRARIEWRNPAEIEHWFKMDWKHLSAMLDEHHVPEGERVIFFRRLINQYPCTSEMKKIVLNYALRGA